MYDVTARALAIVGIAVIGLTALGIYGLVAYTVKQSEHEIGIRTAIGATRAQIVGRFLTRGVTLGATGTALGMAAALGITPLLSPLLYGVSTADAVSFAAAGCAVMFIALIASLIPAWRAARVDPLIALRHH